MEDVVIAGGTEMMSYPGLLANPAEPLMLFGGNLRLRASHPQSHQGVCADAIATLEGITRADLDALALESQRRADVAIAEHRFDRSVVSVYHQDGHLAFDRRISKPADHGGWPRRT